MLFTTHRSSGKQSRPCIRGQNHTLGKTGDLATTRRRRNSGLVARRKRAEANEKRKATRERNKAAKHAQAAEEADAFSKVQHDRGGGSDGEAASGYDRSERRSDESDSGEETDAMEVN